MSSQRAEQLVAIAIVLALYFAWFGCDVHGHHYGLDPWHGQATVDGAAYP